MRVYRHGAKEASLTLRVCPGSTQDGVETSAFYNTSNEPITFDVQFYGGCAEVIDELGRYLVSKGLAHASPLIVPNAIALPA